MSLKTPSAVLTQVASDWQGQFPDLKRFKGGQKLLKRVGGIVLGIELEKYFDVGYRPKPVIFNLLDPTARSFFPCVVQSLRNPKGLQLTIRYTGHSQEYLQACDIMRRQARVRLDGVPTLLEVIRGILKYIDGDLMGTNPFQPCKAVMLLSRMIQDADQRDQYFQAALERLLRYPAQYVEVETGGTEQWIVAMRSRQSEELLRAMSENIERFKFEGVPLLGDLVV